MVTAIMLFFLIIMSIEDIRWQKIHSDLLYAFLATGIVIWFINGKFNLYEFAGGIVLGALIVGLSIMMPGKVGEADGIVYAATGAFLGLSGNLMLIFISTFLAGTGSLFAIAVLRKNRDDTLPLIPFIAAGYVILLIMKER